MTPPFMPSSHVFSFLLPHGERYKPYAYFAGHPAGDLKYFITAIMMSIHNHVRAPVVPADWIII